MGWRKATDNPVGDVEGENALNMRLRELKEAVQARNQGRLDAFFQSLDKQEKYGRAAQ